jgi:predicted porin
MKKSLFALAAVGAIAGTAQAQSSVTVYGVMDLGYIGANTRVANNSITNVPGGVTNSTYSSFADSAESTSRLGFKGTEDLGGGLSAFFTVETALTPDLQNAISSSTGTANRQSFAGLKKSGVGQFAFGTQYTTIFNAASITDPGMLNNMMGNVVYDKYSGIGANQGNAAATTTQAGSNAAGTYNYSGMQTNTSFTVRANNMLSVATDTFAGFQGNAMYVYSGTNTNSATVAGNGYTSGQTSHTAWGLGVNYTWQKLLVTANYQNFTDKNPYTIGTNGLYSAGAPVMNGWGGTSVQGTNAKDNQQYYAATYDFGILKAYLQYVNRKTMDVNNSTSYIARTAQQIGVRSFVTPTVETWASIGTGKYTGSEGTTGNSFVGLTAGTSAGTAYQGGGSNAASFRGFQIGSNYWLSKRTNLYAIYGQESQSNQIWANGTPTAYNMNNYAVGVRHTF